MTPEQFFHLCAQHDWTYQFSDEHRAWRRGQDQRETLCDALKANPSFNVIYEAWALYINARSDAKRPQLADFICNPLELSREERV